MTYLLLIASVAYALWAYSGDDKPSCKQKKSMFSYFGDMDWHPFQLLRTTVTADTGDTTGMLQSVKAAFDVPPFTVDKGVSL